MARISPGTMTAAIFAILVGLAGAYAVRQYLNEPLVTAVEQETEYVTVPTASNTLVAGRTVTINDITLRQMDRATFEQSKYAGQQFMVSAGQIAGQTLRESMKEGDVFLTRDFYPDGMSPGVASLLKPGQRAVTVGILNIGAVAGFARPGTLVDVLYRSTPTPNLPEVTMTLLEAVEVLAVGKMFIPDHDISVGGTSRATTGSVTLAVSPSQAKALKVVEGRGEITLTLRGPIDPEMETVSHVIQQAQKVTLRQILGLPELDEVKKMDIYLGGQKNTLFFGAEVVQPSISPIMNGDIRTPVAADQPGNGRTLTHQPVSHPQVSAVGGVRRPGS